MSIALQTIPSVTRSREHTVTVSLADFNADEIAEYLREQGYQVDGTWSKKFLPQQPRTRSFREHDANCDCDGPDVEGMLIENGELDRMRTLLLCGQAEAAREYLFDIVEEHIGRSLRGPK